MTTGELAPYPMISWPDHPEVSQVDEELAPIFGTIPEWPSEGSFPDISLLENSPQGQRLLSGSPVIEMAFDEDIPTLPVISTGYLNIEAISARLNSNLSYAVEKIKSAPSTMLLELQAPWCHVTLYKDEMPRVMQG